MQTVGGCSDYLDEYERENDRVERAVRVIGLVLVVRGGTKGALIRAT